MKLILLIILLSCILAYSIPVETPDPITEWMQGFDAWVPEKKVPRSELHRTLSQLFSTKGSIRPVFHPNRRDRSPNLETHQHSATHRGQPRFQCTICPPQD